MGRTVYKTGDQHAAAGTTAWADWQRSRLKHAIKDVHFEARQIVQVIRDMCAGEKPAWHLMTRPAGAGFRTFEEFVTSPDGLAYPDYGKFRAVAVSEPGVMTEREYDLLTAAPAPTPAEAGKRKGCRPSQQPPGVSRDKTAWLRAISRADPLVRGLFTAGLIDLKVAARFGDRAKAAAALAAVRAVGRNGDDRAYRRAVNDAARKAFGLTRPTPYEAAKKAVERLTPADRRRLRTYMDKLAD